LCRILFSVGHAAGIGFVIVLTGAATRKRNIKKFSDLLKIFGPTLIRGTLRNQVAPFARQLFSRYLTA
jgi:hypothetical protein